MNGEQVGFTIAHIIGAVTVIGAVILLRFKHRVIWREIFAMKATISVLEKQLILARKEILCATVQGVRLPIALPSQNGEEILLWNFFERARQGFYVEVGAHNGRDFSNTYFLEAVGWNGVLVEPNPDLFREMVVSRRHSRCVHAAVVGSEGNLTTTLHRVLGDGLGTLSFTVDSTQHRKRVTQSGGTITKMEVPCATLSTILGDVIGSIDLISIDVEGAELDVLRGLDFDRHAPRVFVVEDNTGGRDRRVSDFLADMGYKARYTLGENVFFTSMHDIREFS